MQGWRLDGLVDAGTWVDTWVDICIHDSEMWEG